MSALWALSLLTINGARQIMNEQMPGMPKTDERQMPITRYSPVSSLKLDWAASLKKAGRGVFLYRHFIWQMAKTSFLSSFKNTSLGIFWAFVLPLAAPMVYVLLQFMGVFSLDPEFPRALYVVAGFFFWNLWAETTMATMNCVQRNAKFVKKNDVPLLVVYIGNLGTILFSVIPTSVLLLALALYYNVGSHLYLLLLPVLGVLVLLLGLGLGMLLSIFAVFSDDFKNLVAIIIRYLMFASAVIFPIPATHWLAEKLHYNPLLKMVDGARNTVLFGFEGRELFIPVLAGIALLLCLLAAKKIINLEDRLLAGID
jgi:lipopolysaccharide transport system permease protein